MRSLRPALSVLGLAAFYGCNETTAPVAGTELPPPADRPADPGLSYDPACLTTFPMQNPIASGGYDPTGIPAITDPVFLAADEADYIYRRDRVFGVEVDGRFLAFPVKIMNYHEVCTFQVGEIRSTASW